MFYFPLYLPTHQMHAHTRTYVRMHTRTSFADRLVYPLTLDSPSFNTFEPNTSKRAGQLIQAPPLGVAHIPKEKLDANAQPTKATPMLCKPFQLLSNASHSIRTDELTGMSMCSHRCLPPAPF